MTTRHRTLQEMDQLAEKTEKHQRRLDELVHESKADEAAAVNNDGRDAQVRYLLGLDAGQAYDAQVGIEAEILRATFSDDKGILAAIERAIEKAKGRIKNG